MLPERGMMGIIFIGRVYLHDGREGKVGCIVQEGMVFT